MPPSYQPPSVESVLDAGKSAVGGPLELSGEVIPEHHVLVPSDTTEGPVSANSGTADDSEDHALRPSGNHSDNTGTQGDTHAEGNSTSIPLSASPLTPTMPTSETVDAFSPVYDKIPKQAKGEYDMSYRSSSPSGVSALTDFSTSTKASNRSAGSNGSGSTITRRAHTGRRGGERPRNGERRQSDAIPEHYDADTTPRPVQMPWFEPNSPDAASQHARRSLEQPRGWKLGNVPGQKNSTARSASSGGSSLNSDLFSERSLGHATDGSLSSPDRSEPADSPGSRNTQQIPCSAAPVPGAQPQRDPFMYMVPGAPYGNLPQHSGPSNGPPQPSPSFYEQFQHPPRPDHLQETGYELLASRLSVGESGAPMIQPMYRRFEALNHRLLLHLQDELMELEEQLHQLDAADTQSRRTHHGFRPASRRQDAMAAGELHFFKTDVLGKIGFKLNQYNQVLSSFKETQSLQSPEIPDIDTFRDYLLSHSPVVENESRFLDIEEDLVSLSRPGYTSSANEFNNSDGLLTPMPRRAIAFPPTPTSPLSEVGSRASAQRQRGRPTIRGREETKNPGVLPLLAGGIAAAFFLPILAFMLIPAFVGRLAVVLVMTVGTALALLQTGALSHLPGAGLEGSEATNAVVCAGVYGAAMAVLAVLI